MEKEKRLQEINERLQLLERQRSMWFRASGMDDGKVMEATLEIKLLKIEKSDLENGTNELEIYKLKRKIKYLEKVKEQTLLLKKIKISKELNKYEEKLKTYKKKRD